jgi:hypothetical protein
MTCSMARVGALTAAILAVSAGPALGNSLITEDTKGVPGTSKRLDDSGAALSMLDVTGDNRRDLFIGQPGNAHDGIVEILGSKAGLRIRHATRLTPSSLGLRNGRYRLGYAIGQVDAVGRAGV